MSLKNHIKRLHREYMLDHHRVLQAERDWFEWKGYPIDWDNPRDINEKIQWLLCFSDTSSWSLCADKYRVRDYVKSKGQEDILIPLLGVWDSASEIDFESLPDRFVLKCNHDSGSTLVLDKSAGFDEAGVRDFLDSHLKKKFGYLNGELYYNSIKPCIIAEKFLQGGDVPGAAADYKVWCFDGEPYSVWVCYGRTSSETYVNIYDLDWNVHPEVSVFTEHYRDGRGAVPRPACLERMLEAASALSKGFPEVRVDFFVAEGRLYFGEMTFASYGGKMDFYTQEYLEELGSKCILPGKKI
ncbi:MAG: glycosyltransferase [Bacteroidales bacterium]|nr:glycosyltransferase [Bacteroidales bacterium]